MNNWLGGAGTMGLIEAKIISMVVLGAVSILLGLIPLVIVSRFGFSSEDITWTTNTVLSGILCFGGGVLMGTGFIHLLPEVSRGFECYQQSHQVHFCILWISLHLVDHLIKHLIYNSDWYSDRHWQLASGRSRHLRWLLPRLFHRRARALHLGSTCPQWNGCIASPNSRHSILSC